MSSGCPDTRRHPQAAAARSALAALAGAAFAALAASLPADAGTRQLRVCADPNNMPFSNAAGEGFENRIVEVVAQELGAEVSYVWWAQRRGFIRNTLRDGLCDVVPGTPANLEMLRTTAPYYRSSYVFVTRQGEPSIASFDDPRLKELRVGVQLIGDDGANSPPVHALAKRGILGRLVGFPVYGDYGNSDPGAPVIAAVAAGSVDLTVAWGPTAGYFAARQAVPLALTPVSPSIDGPLLPMVYDISMGVRREDDHLRAELDAALERRRAEIDRILADYGVPRLDERSAAVR